jgi:pimeloyl-ACP methyl ester carboxylesterase
VQNRVQYGVFCDRDPVEAASPQRRSKALPSWLTETDLDVYAREYKRTGFRGGLNPYRNMDRDWKDLPQVGVLGLKPPTLFVGGKRDPAVIFGRFDPMIAAAPNLRKIIFLPECGHWTQQERPKDVNALIIEFLEREFKQSKNGT